MNFKETMQVHSKGTGFNAGVAKGASKSVSRFNIQLKDIDNNPITIDQLVSSNFLDLDLDSYALYIPRDELLKRNCYNWFVYLKPEEVLQQNTNISKYLLLMQ